MRKQLEADRLIKATISRFEVFKTPSNRKRALIVAVMMWFKCVFPALEFAGPDKHKSLS